MTLHDFEQIALACAAILLVLGTMWLIDRLS
jgi:hypothetical protein